MAGTVVGRDAIGVDFLDQLLNDGSHGVFALLVSFSLELSALRFELLNLGVEVFKGNEGHSRDLDRL